MNLDFSKPRLVAGGRRLAGAAAALGAAVLLTGSPVASAHDAVISASPGDGATVQEFPREVKLEFSGMPKPQFNTMAVVNQDTGEEVFSGNPKLEKQFISMETPADKHPGPGKYTIGYQITSSDGHATRGNTTFVVAGGQGEQGSNPAPGGSESPKGQSDPSQTNDGSDAHSNEGSHLVPFLVGGLVLLGVAVAIVVALTKRK